MGVLEKLKKTKAFLEELDNVDEKSFSEVVLEAAGVNIPLPTQEQAQAFYTEVGDPNNLLTTIDPQNWTNAQYLEYQSDVRKFQVKNRFKGIKDARKLKREKNKEKQEKERKKFKLDFITSIFQDVQKDLKENIPEDQKPKGTQKLGQFAGNITKILAKSCLPTLLNMIEQVGLDTFETKKQQALEELGIDETLDEFQNLTDPAQIQELQQRLCPTPEVLESIIQQRNGIVSFLNNQQEKINSLKSTADTTGNIADDIQALSTGIELSAFIANAATKIPGISALPFYSVVRSTITDLDFVNQIIKFDREGNPRIPPLRGAVSAFSLPLNQVNIMITRIVLSLRGFDEIISLCSPNATLELLSNDVLATLAIQLSASDTDTGSLYKGFRLEIEEKPFSNAVTQRRAIGVNNSGVTLISTEYSFASNPQVLIEELKFTIDRDNLKAY